MSVFGKNIVVSIFGASHEKYIGLTVHNYPSGINLDLELIRSKLSLRRGMINLTSKRFEVDDFEIISGYFNSYTTGAPLTILIKNSDIKSIDYEKQKDIIRPSHADYTYYKKYDGYNDYRGGGVSSGRLTVALIVLGALAEMLLKDKNIIVASRIKQIKHLKDIEKDLELNDLLLIKEQEFPVLDETIKKKMIDLISKTKEDQDSLGAIVETYIEGCPIGLGEPFFDSFESILSHLIFSIPGIKGIEFGKGFDFVNHYGSEVNDEIRFNNGQVVFLSNNNGGINGGITNGNKIIFRTVFKPTSSIGKIQKTINIKNSENIDFSLEGRHDAIIALKGIHVVNAVTYYAILELLMGMNIWKN